MSEAYKFGVSYSKGSPTFKKKSRTKLTWRTKGGDHRDHDTLVELAVTKVRFLQETYPKSETLASRHILLINDIEIRDRLTVSNINKFLYFPQSESVLVAKASYVRTNDSAQECSLNISMKDVRLNIDQDTLLFVINFGTDIHSDDLATYNVNTTDVQQHPVMTVDISDAAKELKARRMVSQNIMLLEDHVGGPSNPNTESSSQDTKSPTFFKSIVFHPDVSINIDYQGKRVELSHGTIAGLIMGLGQLNCSKIILKSFKYRHGVLGLEKLVKLILQTWLNDIKKRQLPKILGGVGPMHSFIQLCKYHFILYYI